MQEKKKDSLLSHLWMPIILQTIGILIAAFSYSSALEHRLTLVEAALKTQNDVLFELKTISEKQDNRMQLMESSQSRLLALEDFIYRKAKP